MNFRERHHIESERDNSSCVEDSHTDEIIVGVIIIFIVLYTFYRLYHVWATKLNFIEVIEVILVYCKSIGNLLYNPNYIAGQPAAPTRLGSDHLPAAGENEENKT